MFCQRSSRRDKKEQAMHVDPARKGEAQTGIC